MCKSGSRSSDRGNVLKVAWGWLPRFHARIDWAAQWQRYFRSGIFRQYLYSKVFFTDCPGPCHELLSHLSWSSHISRIGVQLNIPETWPSVDKVIRKETPCNYRYSLNYCTFNYSMSFWSWEQLQHELDLMAMQGIYMGLMINGAEKVWQNTLGNLIIANKKYSSLFRDHRINRGG